VAAARWFAPDNADALATLLAEYPGARIVAGATDVGLWVTKKLVDLETVIFVGDIAELGAMAETPDGLTAAPCAMPMPMARWRGSARTGRTGAPSAVCRCAMPAPSAAISPMARPSAMARRR
jgi:hypothetical protein